MEYYIKIKAELSVLFNIILRNVNILKNYTLNNKRYI